MGIHKFFQRWFDPAKPATKCFDYKKDYSHKPGKHIQQFVNKWSTPMEVYVEMYPDLYILQPDDEMTIIYQQDPNWLGLGLHTIVHQDCLQIYLQEFDTAVILINGKQVEPQKTQNET